MTIISLFTRTWPEEYQARNGVLDILSRETSVVTVETVYAALLEQGCKVNFHSVPHPGNVYRA